jgi:hypothetical protein
LRVLATNHTTNMPQPEDDDYVPEEEIPGLVVNVHRDWNYLEALINHQATFHAYETHLSEVLDEVLSPDPDNQRLLTAFHHMEAAVSVAPNPPQVAQVFHSFRAGMLEFHEMLHQLEGAEFDVLSEIFDNYWPYDL